MISHLETRKLLCFDGLYYSYEILNHYYSNLYETCSLIQKDNKNAILALTACWGFIDSLHRIRSIATSTPGINSKSREMRKFLDDTKLAEDYRHYIQHLSRELARNPPNPSPVWGSVSWVDKENSSKCHTAMLGAQIEGTTVSSCVFDTLKRDWVSRVCLSIGDGAFNFDPIYESAISFRNFIIPEIIESSPNEVTLHENIPIVTLEINLPNK